jgi:transposase
MMIIQLTGQAQDLLGKTELVVVTERVDDVALLLGQMMKMGLPEILDPHLPRHWKQEGLSWGWTAVIWLAYILSEGDHRQVAMEPYVRGMKQTLGRLTAPPIRVLDFSDDRLAHLLKPLSKAKHWHPIEQALNERSMTVYDLSAEVIRCDATTVSADHEVVDGGLVQCGHSKDDPSRPQIKLMTASLDPLGLPLATTVVSGEQADDGLYIPLLERLGKGFEKPGLLVVGDGKMSALEIRAYLSGRQHLYLSPLPVSGTTAQQMPQWISQGIAKARAGELECVFRTHDKGQEVRVAQGYELERTCRVQEASGPREWPERVLVVHAPAHGERQGKGLEHRLTQAETKIGALTPARGRGKRQITAEAELVKAIDKVLKAYRVEGLLQIAYVKQTECRTQYVGRGRGSAEREQRVIEKVRYQLTDITRDEERIGDLKARFGWKAFVTNATATRLSLADAVLCYRHEYRIERIFNRLKSRLPIAPMFVSREDQIQGLTYLLTLGVRVLTVMEFTLRRSLQKDQATLPGLHPENRHKGSDKPTAERVLKAFSKVTLTIIKDTAGREVGRWLTPLSSVQQDILRRLGLEASLYQQLEILNTRK